MQKRSANMCVRRKQSTQQTPTTRAKRKTMKRDFYGNYASPDEVVNLDEDLHNDMSFLYPWCPSVRQGGKRKSARLLWKESQRKILETTREKMKHFPISQLIRRRRQLTTTQTATISTQQITTQPVDLATTQQVETVEEEETTIDNLLTQKSKRRLIQISFEIMGTPDEFDSEENNQWMGRNGIVNVIRDFIGLKSHRARSQILSVLRCIKNGQEQGVEIDAGKKMNAQRSGRKSLLNIDESVKVARCLREGFGLQMTRAIINREREKEHGNQVIKVHKSSVQRSAKKVFSGECRNRGTKPTGNRDPTSVWCTARHEWSLQLQQQFREDDTPGESMIGKPVCKWFEDKLFVGEIISYDDRRKWYKVRYTDGDEEELTFRELRVPEWKQIPRQAVLWLDEKVLHVGWVSVVVVSRLCLLNNSPHPSHM